MNFPITYTDNFFNHPNKILDIAKNMEFFRPDKNESWKGLRSKPIHTTHPDLFHYIIDKVFSIYYDFNLELVDWKNTHISFHKMNKEEIDSSDIHTDQDSLIAGVVYLNKDGDINNGTTIYDNYDNEILKFSNTYNSLICYDSKYRHCVTSCDKEIINLVFFVDTLQVKQTPLDRFRRVNLNYDF